MSHGLCHEFRCGVEDVVSCQIDDVDAAYGSLASLREIGSTLPCLLERSQPDLHLDVLLTQDPTDGLTDRFGADKAGSGAQGTVGRSRSGSSSAEPGIRRRRLLGTSPDENRRTPARTRSFPRGTPSPGHLAAGVRERRRRFRGVHAGERGRWGRRASGARGPPSIAQSSRSARATKLAGATALATRTSVQDT